MTHQQRKCRFVERYQAIACPVCRGTVELRRTTWDDPERKLTALDAFQAKHAACLKTGMPPSAPALNEVERVTPEQRRNEMWRAGMARHAGALNGGIA